MSGRYGTEKAMADPGVAYTGPLEYVVDREFKDGHPPRRLTATEAAAEMNRLYSEVERLKAENDVFRSLSDEEIEAELDSIEAEPLSEERIREMVKFATDDDFRAIAMSKFELWKECEHLKADAARLDELGMWIRYQTSSFWVEHDAFSDLMQQGETIRDAIDKAAGKEATWLAK